jgi:hypothetical protein
VSRVGLNDTFRTLIKAGRTRETAARDLYDKASREDGRLQLWCGEGKDPLPWDYIRDCLRFEPGDNEIKVFGPYGLSSGERLDQRFPYYLDAHQAAGLIAELTEPKRKRAKSLPSARKAWALDQLRQLIKAGDKNPQRALLRRWQTKYGGHFRDLATRERFQRSFLRWRRSVEVEIAAEKKSDT